MIPTIPPDHFALRADAAGLSGDRRTAAERYLCHGQEPEEIAAHLGVSSTRARRLVYVSLAIMQQQFWAVVVRSAKNHCTLPHGHSVTHRPLPKREREANRLIALRGPLVTADELASGPGWRRGHAPNGRAHREERALTEAGVWGVGR